MQVYKRALAYFRPDWKLVLVWLSLIAAATGLGLLTAWPMAVLVDAVLSTTPKDQLASRVFLSILPNGRVGQIIGLALIGLAIKVLQDSLTTVQSIISNHINYNGLLRVRCDLYRKLQVLSLSYHRSQPQGDAIYRLSSDTFGCQTVLQVVVNMLVAVVTLGVMTWILASRSWQLTLLAFSIAPVLALTNVVYGRKLKERSLECREQDAAFTTTVQRSMSCIGLVQTFGREQHEFGEFRKSVRATIAAWWRLNWQQMAYNMIIGITFGLGGAAIFGYGGYLVYRDQMVNHAANGMTIGDLLVFLQYLAMLWNPLCTLTGFPAAIQSGAAMTQRVFEVLDCEQHIAEAPDAVSLARKPRKLELEDVQFAYENGRPVLDGVSATIQPGQMVAFVGSSGVGKSTLLNLLPRFYDPAGGALKLDGVDLRSAKLADVRKHVALVLQESVILPTSIAENIAYGHPGASEAQIREAARLARASEFIEQLPEGYATQITEGGSNLSGGQRQRISIARALLTEAPIIVLDEPTSALDPHHEHMVTQSLKGLKGQRTVVIVSHRLSTVTDCDQIFMMSQGRIIEHGTHAQLMARRGAYYEMARHQMEMEETAEEPVACAE